MRRERIYADARKAVLEDGVDYVEFTRQGVVNLYNPQGLWQADEEHLTGLLNDDEVTKPWLVDIILIACKDPADEELKRLFESYSLRHLCIMYAETYLNG